MAQDQDRTYKKYSTRTRKESREANKQMKSDKSHESSIYNKKISKMPVKVVDEVRNPFNGLRQPITNRYLERLATDLVHWAMKDDSIVLQKFLAEKGITTDNFYRWGIEYPALIEARNIAKMLIGCRREEGGLKKELDGRMVTASMPMYFPEWKEFMEWKAKLAEKSDTSNLQKVVVIEKFRDPEEVIEVDDE